jgi:hypothetical protein
MAFRSSELRSWILNVLFVFLVIILKMVIRISEGDNSKYLMSALMSGLESSLKYI